MLSNNFRCGLLLRIFIRGLNLFAATKENKFSNQSQFTYIELEEQIPLLRGNLIICTKGQVMDFRALSKIHPLKQKHTQMLVKLWPYEPNCFAILFCCLYLLWILDVCNIFLALTVPDRMSWGQQFRRWLLQTRSSVNLTLCRVSSPATIQIKFALEKPNIFQAWSRLQLLWKTLQ